MEKEQHDPFKRQDALAGEVAGIFAVLGDEFRAGEGAGNLIENNSY
ncbi:hypothetical protein [Endothiovibrio diazotrophicus]